MREQKRDDDMGNGALSLFQQDDGDMIVALKLPKHGLLDVEFCAPGAGGGRSPHTWRALVHLLLAMQKDNERVLVKSEADMETYCHPRDSNGGAKRWLLFYDDADRSIDVFDNETDARRAYAIASGSWNCHLFVSEKADD